MKHLEALLSAWQTRAACGAGERFSEPARQRVATLFIELALSLGHQSAEGKEQPDLDAKSTQVAELGIDEALAEPAFLTELRTCQLSLLEILASSASHADLQPTASAQQSDMQRLVDCLRSLDQLIIECAGKFTRAEGKSSTSETSPESDGKHGKTLQHEIRTPLQGALLTTELMLEDAGHGDPVSADDILAVRKSIETAVGILNDFASRSSPD